MKDTSPVNRHKTVQPRCRLPFINCRFKSRLGIFNHIAIIDGGASRTTFPVERLTPELKSLVKPTTVKLTGVGGECVLAGQIK